MARNDNSIETIQKTLDLAGQELRILHQISQSISSTLDLDQVLHQIVDLVIDVTRGDACLIYLLDDTASQATLVATAGIRVEAPASPRLLDLAAHDAMHIWPLPQAMASGTQVVDDLADRFGPLPGGPWPESPRTALVMPIMTPTNARTVGFVIAGVSSRRELDAPGCIDHRQRPVLVRLGLQSPVPQVQHPIRRPDDGRVVGREDEPDAPALEFAHHLQQRAARRRVELRRGLVGDHEGGIADHGASERQPLLFAAGQLRWEMASARPEPQGLQQLVAVLPPGPAPEPGRER